MPSDFCDVRDGDEPSPWRAVRYLAAYNLMFVLPLIVILVLALAGLRLTSLTRWSRRNVVTAKLLAAVLFFALALMLAVS